MTLDRDAAATDALLTDLYLDALLAGAVLDAAADRARGGRTTAGGSRTPDAFDAAAGSIDPAARRAAERLRRDLVRVHPSFRFEERLATRLAEAAMAMRLPVAAGAEGRVVPFRAESPAGLPEGGPGAGPDGSALEGPIAPDDALSSSAAGAASTGAPAAGDAHRPATRPLLIGGALTSAALSIAGAAFVAWRFGRPGRPSTPMARAARAVRDARLAAAPPTRSLD